MACQTNVTERATEKTVRNQLDILCMVGYLIGMPATCDWISGSPFDLRRGKTSLSNFRPSLFRGNASTNSLHYITLRLGISPLSAFVRNEPYVKREQVPVLAGVGAGIFAERQVTSVV